MSSVVSRDANMLSDFHSMLFPVMEVISKNCPSHTFYRGEFYVNPNGNLCLDLLGSNIEGTPNRCELEFDFEEENLFISNKGKVVLHKHPQVYNTVLEFAQNLSCVNKPISTVYFEFSRKFSKMVIEDDKKEPGSVILYLSDDILHRFGMLKLSGNKLAMEWDPNKIAELRKREAERKKGGC